MAIAWDKNNVFHMYERKIYPKNQWNKCNNLHNFPKFPALCGRCGHDTKESIFF